MTLRTKDLPRLVPTTVTQVLHDSAGGTYRVQHNLAGAGAPTVNDDSSAGYSIGSEWVYAAGTAKAVCVDATVGAAIWIALLSNASLSSSTPQAVGFAGSAGSGSSASKSNHVHAERTITTVSGSQAMLTSVGVYLVDLSGGPADLTLPSPIDYPGARWTIVDKTGQAGTNNFTLKRNGSENINGAGSNLVLNTNGFSVDVWREDNTHWVCR